MRTTTELDVRICADHVMIPSDTTLVRKAVKLSAWLAGRVIIVTKVSEKIKKLIMKKYMLA